MSTAVLDQVRTILAGAFGSRLTGALPDDSSRPRWYREMQAAAWEAFEALPVPSRRDETWRFSSLKHVSTDPYSAPQELDQSARNRLLLRSAGLAATAGRMVFANDQLLAQDTHGDSLRQKGVIWKPLGQAASEHDELFRKYFMREEARLGGRKFAALHKAWVSNGTFLYIPRGVEIDLPVEAFHWLEGDNGSCFPHTLVIAEEMSKVTLLDHFESSDQHAAGMACGVNDLWLGAGAKVTYVCTQNWSRKTLAVQINNTVVGRDAAAVALNLNQGGAYVRGESVSYLRGPGGRSDMLSLSIADGQQEVDQRTLQIHEVPNTSSDLLYKNALDGHARTIFAGLIRVDHGAHKTDAYQKVRNLLLSDDCEANSAPGLEIEADDVRCTHGATSGQVDAEELFYLQSRGIPTKIALQLIVLGFLDEVLQRLPDPNLQSHLRSLVEGRFSRE